MPANVYAIRWGFDHDPSGLPLALVIFADRTHERFYHHELGR
jgi:hypothetical protein